MHGGDVGGGCQISTSTKHTHLHLDRSCAGSTEMSLGPPQSGAAAQWVLASVLLGLVPRLVSLAYRVGVADMTHLQG